MVSVCLKVDKWVQLVQDGWTREGKWRMAAQRLLLLQVCYLHFTFIDLNIDDGIIDLLFLPNVIRRRKDWDSFADKSLALLRALDRVFADSGGLN